jgi:hypothetical protein
MPSIGAHTAVSASANFAGEQGRFGDVDPSLRYAYIRVDHDELLVLVSEVGGRLIDLRMGLHLCRLGVVERARVPNLSLAKIVARIKVVSEFFA